MKTTADKFKKKPHEVYSKAASGETVIINHDHYRDKVFELRSRDREPFAYMAEAKETLNEKEIPTTGRVTLCKSCGNALDLGVDDCYNLHHTKFHCRDCGHWESVE